MDADKNYSTQGCIVPRLLAIFLKGREIARSKLYLHRNLVHPVGRDG